MISLEEMEIFDRAKHPRAAGTLEHPDLRAEGANWTCGDEVRLELSFDANGAVNQAVHACRACAICTAAADMLCEEILPSKTTGEIIALPSEELVSRLGAELSPLRLKCALLPLETLRAELKTSLN